jgi:hypothetical protein
MAKQRPSLKGRGSEILFGAPPAVEIEPRGSAMVLEEPLPSESESTDPESLEELLVELGSDSPPSQPEAAPVLDEEEVERALYEEARDGELQPGEEEDLSLVDEQPPPTPEMEKAFFEEAVGAEEPPEPVAEAPSPTLEETMEERTLSAEEALYEPPPPEVSDVAGGVLPPRSRPVLFEMGKEEPLAEADIQEPEKKVERLELPEQQLSEEEAAALLSRWGGIRMQELDQEISKTYDLVLSKVGENDEIATDCYNQLLKARDIILRREAARISQAEYYIEQVRARLKRATESEIGAKKYAWWITAWGFVWGAVFLTALILLNQPWFRNVVAPPVVGTLAVNTEIFLPAMIWGGIGGVVAVWYSLFKHVGLRDFDAQYNLSYVGKPFLGLVLGATVYMIFELMLKLAILPAGLQTTTGTIPAVTPWIVYPLAWASGFKENRVFDLVDRVIKRIFSGEKSPEAGTVPELDIRTQ